MIYFIQAASGGPIKIGVSDNPEVRLKDLQCSHHERLVLRRVMEGGAALERELHARFADHRIRGEWFHPHPVLAKVGDCRVRRTKDVEQGRKQIVITELRSGASRASAFLSAGVWEKTFYRWIEADEAFASAIRQISDDLESLDFDLPVHAHVRSLDRDALAMRNAQIRRERELGATTTTLSRRWGLTQPRITQICRS
jgi:hypothetical protein